MRVPFSLLCAFAALNVTSPSPAESPDGQILWEQLPDLPAAAKASEQKGLAGLFGGVHNDVLILAGGANFPDAAPWKNGIKSFWNDIYVLEKKTAGKSQWVADLKAKLPKPIAYGASVSTAQGIVCIGGTDATQCYPDVFLLTWNPDSREVEIHPLPPLPTPLAHCTAAVIGSTVYVAGGITDPFGEGTKAFFALDLDPKPDPESAPGPTSPDDPANTDSSPESKPDPTSPDDPANPGSEPEATPDDISKPADSQPTPDPDPSESPDDPSTPEASTPENEEPSEEPAPIKPEVIEDPDSPEPQDPGKKADPEDDVDPPAPKATLRWKELPSWDGNPRAFAASAVQSDGERECFFLFSGRNPKPDGTSELFADSHKFDPTSGNWVRFPDIAPPDQNPRSVVAASAYPEGDRRVLIVGGDNGTMAKVSALVVSASNSTSKDAYLKLNETILENHPGYSRDILALDTIDGIWRNVATFPEFCPVTTPIFRWSGSFVVPSGEIRPGVRSPKIWQGTWKAK